MWYFLSIVLALFGGGAFLIAIGSFRDAQYLETIAASILSFMLFGAANGLVKAWSRAEKKKKRKLKKKAAAAAAAQVKEVQA